ncbi:MAG: AAA family ATPase [Chloroflexi bacterium]|nr:AAA family ATPase [Chloroflexota bacterium]
MSASQPSFGELLKRARRAAGMTQEALATRAGLSGRVISDLERQVQHTPRPATVRLLVEALPISASERAFLTEVAIAGGESAEQLAPGGSPGLPTLVDRVAERTAIEALLTSGSATLFMEGEPGIGKTRMLDEAARLGEQHGWHVLRASAAPSATHAAQDPVVAALRRDIEVRSASELRHSLNGCHSLLHVLPELVELGALTAPAQPPAAHLLARDTGRYLRNVALPAGAGTLLLLDDLQCADAQQLDLLAHLITMGSTLRLAVVGTYRPSYRGQAAYLRTLLGRLASDQRIRHLVLPPLSPVAASQLFASRTALSTGQRGSLQECGGVPLYLVSVAQEPGPDVPWTVREHVLERVRALPRATVVLEGVAVAGDQATLPLLVAMTGGPRLPVLETLEAACRERLLVEDVSVYRFAYPIVRRVMLEGLSHARGAHLRQRADTYLQQSLRPEYEPVSGERAHHLAVLRAHRRRAAF